MVIPLNVTKTRISPNVPYRPFEFEHAHIWYLPYGALFKSVLSVLSLKAKVELQITVGTNIQADVRAH